MCIRCLPPRTFPLGVLQLNTGCRKHIFCINDNGKAAIYSIARDESGFKFAGTSYESLTGCVKEVVALSQKRPFRSVVNENSGVKLTQAAIIDALAFSGSTDNNMEGRSPLSGAAGAPYCGSSSSGICEVPRLGLFRFSAHLTLLLPIAVVVAILAVYYADFDQRHDWLHWAARRGTY